MTILQDGKVCTIDIHTDAVTAVNWSDAEKQLPSWYG